MKGPRSAASAGTSVRDPLDRAYGFLDRHLPERIAAAFRVLRRPGMKWLRLPLGLFCILCSFFWFLPVVGLEFLPIGLLLLAEDVPSLRRPVGHFVMWLELKYLRALRWWRSRRAGQPRRAAWA